MKSLYKKLLCLALALLMLVSAIPAAAAPADGARDSYPDVKFPICEQTDLGDVYGIRYANPRSFQEMTIGPLLMSKPTTGHSFVDGVCSGCGFEAPDHDYVDGICIYCDLPDSASCEHSYDNGVVVRESTCAVKGEKVYTCTLCGDTKSEALKLANHYYIDKLCVNCARPAREDMDCGSYHNFRDCNCMVCGYTCIDHVYDNDTCQICGFSKNISSGDECSHQSYTGSWITKATCTTNGQVQYTCLGCDHSYTENVPAPGHEFADGNCIYCNQAVRFSCDHSCGSYSEREEGAQCGQAGMILHTCMGCGHTTYEYAVVLHHNFEDGVCIYCGVKQNPYYNYSLLEDGTIMILNPKLEGSELVIPEEVDGYTVSAIADNAFIWRAFKKVTTPASLTVIECYAFHYSQLQDLILTGDAPAIADSAFEDCDTITIHYPAGNETYTQELFDSIPNTVWEPYCLDHSYVDGICRHCGEADPDYVAPVIPGDVNGDRQMNIIDVAMLYGSIKGTATLDDYATACGDINHDGQVNIIDVAMAYKQVQG